MTVIVLKSYPGVGKHTVARDLAALLPGAKVFTNHFLIDVAATIYDRGHQGYQPFRHALRQSLFTSLTQHATGTTHPYHIFTEAQSSSNGGTAVMQEYLAFAKASSRALISIRLESDLETNISRLTSGTRGQSDTKLTDVNILKSIRANEDIYKYGNAVDLEITYDTSGKTPSEVAKDIVEQITEQASKDA